MTFASILGHQSKIMSEVRPSSNVSVKDDQFWSKTIETIRKGFLPRLEFADERPFDQSDFKNHFKTSLESLNLAANLCEQVQPDEVLRDPSLVKHFVVPVLLLCFENVQQAEWVTKNHIEASYRILSLAKRHLFKVDSVSAILIAFRESDQIMRWCLEELRPKLLGNLWRQHPGAQQCFVYILNQFTFPNVSIYITEFLPFSLQFADDWQTKNKLIGVQCLRHIVREVSPTELKWFGRSELLKTTLVQLMHVKEPEFIDLLFGTIVEFLAKVDGPKETPERAAKFDSWDEVIHKLLVSMEIESKAEIKRCYIKHLLALLENIGLGLVRWMTSVVRVCGIYLTYPDPETDETRCWTLKVLYLTITVGGDRVSGHSLDIFEALLRLLYEISPRASNEELLKLTTDCLIEGSSRAPEDFLRLCHGLDAVDVNPVFNAALKNAFEKSKINFKKLEDK